MSMLLFLALQVAPPVIDPILEPRRDPPPSESAQPPASAARDRLGACATLAEQNPEAAVAEGARWLLENGGADAEQCLALGYVRSGEWQQAVEAFDRAAESLPAGDTRRSALLAQAANAALAGGDAAGAKARFDTLLAMPGLAPSEHGEALLDRARALVVLGDSAAAQADLMAAQELAPNDPMVWLFSATLARRQGQVDDAGVLIDRALELDQHDPAILLEAGNIAIQLNAFDVAREAWTRAVRGDADGPAGQAAQRNLDRLAAMVAEDGSVPVDLPTPDAAAEDAPETEAPPSP